MGRVAHSTGEHDVTIAAPWVAFRLAQSVEAVFVHSSESCGVVPWWWCGARRLAAARHARAATTAAGNGTAAAVVAILTISCATATAAGARRGGAGLSRLQSPQR